MNIDNYLQPLIKVGIFHGLFPVNVKREISDSEYAAAAKIVKEIVIKIFGKNYFQKLYDFFKSVLVQNPSIVFALTKKGFLLARIFFALIAQDSKNNPELKCIDWGKIKFFSERAVELNIEEIQKAESIIILDETAIYARSVISLAKKIRAIISNNSNKINNSSPDTPTLSIYVFTVSLNLIKKSENFTSWKKYERIENNTPGNFELATFAGNTFSINYFMKADIGEQKDFLYKIVSLFAALGLPFNLIYPVYYLGEKATEAILNLIKDKVYHYFKYECFGSYGVHQYVAYKKGIDYSNMANCFRFTVNTEKNVSFLIPYVLTKDINGKHIYDLFNNVFGDNSNDCIKIIKQEIDGRKNTFNLFNSSPNNDKDNKKAKFSLESIIYNLTAYFVQSKYTIDEIISKLPKDSEIQYIEDGNNHHFYENIENELTKFQNEAILKFNQGETTKNSIVGIVGKKALKAFNNNKWIGSKISSDIKNGERKQYHITTDQFISDIKNDDLFIFRAQNNENLRVTKKTIRDVFSAERFDSFIQVLGLIEDRKLDTELIKNRSSLTRIDASFFERHGYFSVEYMINTTKDKYKLLGIDSNHILANLVERLEFGGVTLRPHAFDVTKDEKNVGIICRIGENESIHSSSALPPLAVATSLFSNIINPYFFENIDVDEEQFDTLDEIWTKFNKGEIYWKICYKYFVKLLLDYLGNNINNLADNQSKIEDAKFILTQDTTHGGFNEKSMDEIKGYNIKLLKEFLIPESGLEGNPTFINCLVMAGQFGRYCDKYLYSNNNMSFEDVQDDLHENFKNEEEFENYRNEIKEYVVAFNFS